RVDGHRLGGRQAQRLAAAQVEGGAVQPALDGAVLDVPLREADLPVGADVGDRVVVTGLVAHERDGDGTAVRVLQVHAHRLTRLEVTGVAHVLGAHAAACSMVRSNSCSMASSRRSETTGTPICAMSSAKN